MFLFFGLVSCATYQGKVEDARTDLKFRKVDEAIKKLEPLANKPSDDQLVYLLDYAVALQLAGRFQDSARIFGVAEKIADIQDYHSISKITGSLLLSEEMVQYKGDDYEKVLINAVNAVNYLMLGDLDAALVEVRRVNQKLYKFKNEAKRDYAQNPFAYYLSAVIWEADRKYDDAYIAYKNTYDLAPDYPPLKEDLIRAAIKAQRPEELEKWKKQFPTVKIKPEWRDRSMGELVFIYQQGWGPRKYGHPDFPRVPKLYPTSSSTKRIQLEVGPELFAESEKVFSVTDVAIKVLDDQYAGLIAKRAAGVVAKAVVADQIGQHNRLLGDLAFIALNAIDRADLRQWSTLPESFQIVRMILHPGKYAVKATGLDGSGAVNGENSDVYNIEIQPGKKTFLSWRSLK